MEPFGVVNRLESVGHFKIFFFIGTGGGRWKVFFHGSNVPLSAFTKKRPPTGNIQSAIGPSAGLPSLPGFVNLRADE